jgi:hypothetical protein
MSKHHRTENLTGRQNRQSDDQVIPVVTYDNTRNSSLFISSSDKIDGTYSQALYQNDAKLLKQSISSLALKKFHMDYCIDNVNSKNDTIRFLAYPTGFPTTTVYTAIIGKENYTSIIDLYDNIIVKLNGGEGSPPPITFSYLSEGCVVTLMSTGTFQILSCSAVDFGSSCHGLHYTNEPVVDPENMKVVPGLQYTNFVDIVLTELGDSRVTSSTFTGTQFYPLSGHFSRVFCDETTQIPRTIDFTTDTPQYVSYRHRELTSFLVSLYDEYGSIIFSEVNQIGESMYEIPKITYEIKFNLIS